MTLTTAKWTLDDYHRMIEAGILDGRSVELLWGEIIEMAPEGEPHASASVEAGEYLMRLLGDRAQVRPAKPITLPSVSSKPEPDIAIVQRLGRQYRQHHPYPDNIFWVIEYAQTSLSKDLDEKKRLYAEKSGSPANMPKVSSTCVKGRSGLIARRNTSTCRCKSSTFCSNCSSVMRTTFLHGFHQFATVLYSTPILLRYSPTKQTIRGREGAVAPYLHKPAER
jgi:hypothetical protein